MHSTIADPQLGHRPASFIADAISPASEAEHQLSSASSLAAISAPPSEEEVREGAYPEDESVDEKGIQPSPPPVYSPFSFPVLASLAGPSVFGVLVRLGLLAITTYDGHSIFPLAWVQAAGCFIMGFSLGLRDQIGAFYGPLYTAITTGLCGSITSFSSWQLDVFLSWANTGDAQRDWFRDVIDGLSKLLFTLAISMASVNLGLHLSRVVGKRIPHMHPALPLFQHIFSTISVLVYVVTFAPFFAAPFSFRHDATAAMLFSFPGTLVRYVLAMTLTPRFHLFPLGTFVANTIGSVLLGAFHILQRADISGGDLPGPGSCAILQGLADGFCGCLTTVSTFAVEVGALRMRNAWIYVGLSCAVSQILLLIVLGPSWWHAGINDSRVCSFT